MKNIFYIIIILLFFKNIIARELGETEITAEDGIEVFQHEKFYLLKENVEIISDNFNLKADIVKAYFDKDLYDIINIYAEGSAKLDSNEKNLKASSNIIEFTLKDEIIKLTGKNSELILNNSYMLSDGMIEVNNLSGTFFLNGENSKLNNEDILINGNNITGKFSSNTNLNEIIELNVEDKIISNIKTKNIEMFSLKASYNKEKNIIELLEKVRVIRGNEIITGDYGYVDLSNNSYKVSSDNSGKVKVLISQDNE